MSRTHRVLPRITWSDVCREPYRVLFPTGVLCGCLGIGHWLAYALGWLPYGSGFYHASIQMGAYMSCFIIGFLMTALPRFASAAAASTAELGAVLVLLAAQVLLLSRGRWLAAQVCASLLLVTVLAFAGKRFVRKQATVGPPVEFVWIPMALVLGIGGAMALGLGQAGMLPVRWLALGRPMAQQGVVLGVIIGVGGFLGPRLMGRTTLLVTPTGVTVQQAAAIRRRRMMMHGMAAAALVASFLIEGLGWMRAAYGLRAAVVTGELAWTTQFHRRPAVGDFYVQLLWLACWMVVIGLWGAVLLPHARVTMLHFVFLGGASLMTFAVGTMVVMSHAGEGAALRQPLPVLRRVAGGLAAATISRVAADFLPAFHRLLLGVAAASWLVAAVSWLVFALPRVARVPAVGTFERVHEAAKRTLLRASNPPC